MRVAQETELESRVAYQSPQILRKIATDTGPRQRAYIHGHMHRDHDNSLNAANRRYSEPLHANPAARRIAACSEHSQLA
jgi:hypothetical protein